MSHTLVLNADAQPLSILPLSTIKWQDAIRLTFLDKVHVLEWYDDWKVHSATQEFDVPSVIMVKRYVKRLSSVKLTRSNLYLRDEYRCQYCGKRFNHNELTYDHVWPQSKGGDHSWENLVAACKPCNHSKADNIIDPLMKPYEPTKFGLMRKSLKAPVLIRHWTWKRFIDAGEAGFHLVHPHN